jgi:molybdopterin-dependent oxidoreductase alpha subunit
MLADDEARGGVIDWTFIKEKTSGIDEYLSALRNTSWEEIERESGVDRATIRKAADIAMEADSIIACWAMGLTQHPNAVATIQEVVNFLLLGGHFGRRGAGACPVRGHSNVQGDRTVGIYEKPPAVFLDALAREFKFEPPREHGFDTVDSIKAMHDGRAKVFIAMGGNFLSATPDTDFTAQALMKCRLTAHVSTKLNRAHLIHGEQALILPCLGRSEIDMQASGPQFVTVEDSMGVINPSHGPFKPGSDQLKSEPAIVAGLAKATLGARTTVDWDALMANYDRVREHIEHVVPGFDDYNGRIRRGTFYLPNGPRDGQFKTADGKGHFTVQPIWKNELLAGELVMMTIRSHDQFNTTIYGLDDRYRGIYNGRRVIFMNAGDIKENGLKKGDAVDIVSIYNDRVRIAEDFKVVPFSIPPKCCATYFPEANVLVPIDSVAAVSNTPASKYVKVRVVLSKR